MTKILCLLALTTIIIGCGRDSKKSQADGGISSGGDFGLGVSSPAIALQEYWIEGRPYFLFFNASERQAFIKLSAATVNFESASNSHPQITVGEVLSEFFVDSQTFLNVGVDRLANRETDVQNSFLDVEVNQEKVGFIQKPAQHDPQVDNEIYQLFQNLNGSRFQPYDRAWMEYGSLTVNSSEMIEVTLKIKGPFSYIEIGVDMESPYPTFVFKELVSDHDSVEVRDGVTTVYGQPTLPEVIQEIILRFEAPVSLKLQMGVVNLHICTHQTNSQCDEIQEIANGLMVSPL